MNRARQTGGPKGEPSGESKSTCLRAGRRSRNSNATVRAELLLRFAICAVLIAITFAVFGQTLGHDFVNYDDNKYVYENADVSRGVTISRVIWAFTHFDKDNWHPLTSISHMIDCELFDLKPRGHHFTNVLLHTVAVVLLFFVLNRLTGGSSRTGTIWPSFFVAAVFAIHPLRAESVAWIAERKDVLSAVFFMLTLGAYARYTERPTFRRYLVMSILFACGLMAKAMLVTVPLVLLLLDYWPLNRWQRSGAGKLIFEKIPLLILSTISSVATLFAQRQWQIRLGELPFSWRLANAASACVLYLWEMIWPAKLAVIYPHREAFPLWQTICAVALLSAITGAVFLFRRTHPYLVVGWLWYLITLLPVLGFIKVGGLAHADRYTYLPQIGLCVAFTWGFVDFARSWRRRGHQILAGCAAGLIIALAVRGAIQASYWRDSETLWRHTIGSTTNNDLAHFALADFLEKHNRVDEAIREYQAGLRIDPTNMDAETTIGNLLLEAGHGEEAVVHYQNALRLEPSALAHYNLAVGFHRIGRLWEAIVHYKEALRIHPDYPDADYFLGQALLENGQTDEAKEHSDKH